MEREERDDMDRETEQMGKSAARWLQSEVDAGELVRVSVDAGDLQALLDYVKALEASRKKVTKDVYLSGEWHVSILETSLTEDQIELLNSLGKRTGFGENSVEVRDYNPENPQPNWLGHSRVD